MATDIHELAMAERDRLVTALTHIPEVDWQTPSLCAGWTVRDTVAHLLMPYDLSIKGLLVGLVRSKLRFDRFADTWARQDNRTPDQLLTALNTIDDSRFGGSGVPKVAGLSHLVSHGGDIYRPLGIDHVVDNDAAHIVLDELVGRGRRSLPTGILEARRFRATDIDWSHGAGATVSGSAAALIVTLLGRDVALPELNGDGVSGLPSHAPSD